MLCRFVVSSLFIIQKVFYFNHVRPQMDKFVCNDRTGFRVPFALPLAVYGRKLPDLRSVKVCTEDGRRSLLALDYRKVGET